MYEVTDGKTGHRLGKNVDPDKGGSMYPSKINPVTSTKGVAPATGKGAMMPSKSPEGGPTRQRREPKGIKTKERTGLPSSNYPHARGRSTKTS